MIFNESDNGLCTIQPLNGWFVFSDHTFSLSMYTAICPRLFFSISKDSGTRSISIVHEAPAFICRWRAQVNHPDLLNAQCAMMSEEGGSSHTPQQ